MNHTHTCCFCFLPRSGLCANTARMQVMIEPLTVTHYFREVRVYLHSSYLLCLCYCISN